MTKSKLRPTQTKFGVIIALLLLIVGGIFTFLGVKFIRQQQDAQNWPAVQGIVTDTYIKENVNESIDQTDDTITYVPKVVYEYVVDDRVYSGTQLRIGFERSYDRRQKANEAMTAYPVGAEVTVYYNPANPAEAALNLDLNGFNNVALIVGVVLLALGGIVLVRPRRFMRDRT
jgi:hypothetical protein